MMVLMHRSRGQWPTMRSLRASASGFPSSRGTERWVGSVLGGCGYKGVVGAVMGGCDYKGAVGACSRRVWLQGGGWGLW